MNGDESEEKFKAIHYFMNLQRKRLELQTIIEILY